MNPYITAVTHLQLPKMRATLQPQPSSSSLATLPNLSHFESENPTPLNPATRGGQPLWKTLRCFECQSAQLVDCISATSLPCVHLDSSFKWTSSNRKEWKLATSLPCVHLDSSFKWTEYQQKARGLRALSALLLCLWLRPIGLTTYWIQLMNQTYSFGGILARNTCFGESTHL